MSKIAEKKALEEYPDVTLEECNGDHKILHYCNDDNSNLREGYIKGYDQAMQDFMENVEEFFYDRFNIHPHDCHITQYVSDTPLENIDDFVEQFKNYMKNEM